MYLWLSYHFNIIMHSLWFELNRIVSLHSNHIYPAPNKSRSWLILLFFKIEWVLRGSVWLIKIVSKGPGNSGNLKKNDPWSARRQFGAIQSSFSRFRLIFCGDLFFFFYFFIILINLDEYIIFLWCLHHFLRVYWSLASFIKFLSFDDYYVDDFLSILLCFPWIVRVSFAFSWMNMFLNIATQWKSDLWMGMWL